jgi:hypothetical protein
VRHVELSAPGLLLRPWRDSDAPAVLNALREPEIAQWNPQGGTIDEERALVWVRGRADWSAGDHASFAATDPTTGAVLGSVSLHRIHARDASIGYWTVPAARGRGVATAAVGVVTGWASACSGCTGSSCATRCRTRLLPGRRPGRLPGGTLRESYRYGDGKRYDEHITPVATDVWEGPE